MPEKKDPVLPKSDPRFAPGTDDDPSEPSSPPCYAREFCEPETGRNEGQVTSGQFPIASADSGKGSAERTPETGRVEKAVQPEPASGEPKPASELTPEEQMERFEKELKETDWGHQPC